VLADYTYDGLERLAVRTTQNMTPSGTTHYVYDRAGRLLAEASGTGTTVREYVWLDDLPLAVVADVDTSTPSLWYVHADHLDRPIKMTDAAKAVVWDAVYWPFGAVYSITGTASSNLRFPGQYFLLESGLHYNWHRHYDPTLGRYLQPDPISMVTAQTPAVPKAGVTPAQMSMIVDDIPSVLRGFERQGESPINNRSGGALLDFVDGPSLYAYATSSPVMKTDVKGLQTGSSSSAKGTQICLRETCPLIGQYTLGPTKVCIYRCTVQGLRYKPIPSMLPCEDPPFSPGDFR